MQIEELLELKDDYLATNDPTEYEFANNYIDGGWSGLKALRNDPAFGDILNEWKMELSIKIESEGIKMMRDIARTKKTVAAVKYMADRNWEQNIKATKQSIFEDQVRRTMQSDMDEFADDLAMLSR